MEIKEEILDQMIDYMEKMKPMEMNDMSIQIGEYKGYDVRVMLRKPEEES
jgi:hypothetical protein